MGFLQRLAGRTAHGDEPSTSISDEQQRDFQQPLPPQQRLYDPYEGITSAVSGRRAVFRLPDGPEFVFHEEAVARKRSWGESLQFYTGIGYVGGGATGFAIGGYRFLAAPSTNDPALETAKLRTNRLLNTSGSLGRRMACSAAVLGLFFALSESTIGHAASEYGAPDVLVTTAAGFATAALFRSPRGPRAAVVAGTVGAAMGSALSAARIVWPSL